MRRFIFLVTILLIFIFQGMAQSVERIEKITLGGGCFWCTAAIFESVKGVSSVVSGYSGGQTENPTYREVTSGITGHAEVVQMTFDTSVVSVKELLQIFFATHDPTTLNRQGADVGTQYRSVVFYSNEQQRDDADVIIKLLTSEKIFRLPIVTQIEPLKNFFEAEDYHQEYFKNNAQQPYCRVVINPKFTKFKKEFNNYLK